jgi:hypothetical protein
MAIIERLEPAQIETLVEELVNAFKDNGIPLAGKCIAMHDCSTSVIEALEKRFGLRVAISEELPPDSLRIMDADQFIPEAFVTDYKYEQHD